MNSSHFRFHVALVVLIYTATLIAGIMVYYLYGEAKDHPALAAFQNLTPLIVAIPAAWLAFCFQMRQYYLSSTRELWHSMVDSFEEAIQYTHLESPTQQDFGEVQKRISCTIEYTRIVFSNIGEKEGQSGLFPFESLKTIQNALSGLSFGDAATPDRRKEVRNEINVHWKTLRKHYLSQFVRGEPASPDSPYLA